MLLCVCLCLSAFLPAYLPVCLPVCVPEWLVGWCGLFVGLLGCVFVWFVWLSGWLLACWVAGFWGSTLGCLLVVRLLGCWVVGLLGCWVDRFPRQQPTQQRHEKQKRQQGQKRQPNHPPTKLDGPAECAKRSAAPPGCGVLDELPVLPILA